MLKISIRKRMDVDPTSSERLLGYSIIIPAYNEGARVGATLEKVLAYVDEAGWDAEIIAVDDGSRDNTVEIIRGYAEKNPRLRLLQNPGNRGKGYSVRNGMLHAQGELLLFSDADLSAPIEEADKLFGRDRRGRGHRHWLTLAAPRSADSAATFLSADLRAHFQSVVAHYAGPDFKDTQCGFKAFTRDAAEKIFPLQKIERWGFDPELLYLAKKLKFKVAEVPVEWAHCEGTRISPLRDGTRMFVEMLKIRWNAITGKYDGGGNNTFRSGAGGLRRTLRFRMRGRPLLQTLSHGCRHVRKANSHVALHIPPNNLDGSGEVIFSRRAAKTRWSGLTPRVFPVPRRAQPRRR